jgi:hypothetical protein
VITSDPFNNVSENIFEKLNKNHHQNPDHPLGIIKVNPCPSTPNASHTQRLPHPAPRMQPSRPPAAPCA